MAVEIKLPDLGENIDSGTVVRVMVSKGDVIDKDQSLLELETCKATLEIPSEIAGTITEIHVKDGDEVNVGAPLVTVDDAVGDEPSGAEEEKEAEQKKQEEPPRSKEERDTPEPASPPPGRPGESRDSGKSRGIDKDAEPSSTPEVAEKSKGAESAPAPSKTADRLPVAAAPSVRKFAREIGVNLEDVAVNEPGERISIDDVKSHAKRLLTQPAAGAGATDRIPPLPDFEKWGPIDRQPMKAVRKATAQHLARSWSVIPHVTQQDEADITDLERFRKQYASTAEQAGGKLTLTAILLKITASALKAFPAFNASVDTGRNEIIVKQYYHIGVAVDTAKGLLVPVVRDVDKKSIIRLSVELSQVAEKAREGKIQPDEMAGGTFTISNLGGVGGTHFTPLVNYPEVAILGVGRASRRPLYQDGEFVPRLVLPLSLSYDHRIIDGADGARFLRWLAEAIETPLLMALEG